MSLVLLVCAGVFVRAQYTMFTADPGLFVKLQAPLAGAADRILKVAGVESVASGSPLSQEEQGPPTEEVRTPGQSAGSGKQIATTYVSTNYFDTLSIRLLQGRSATNPDDAVVSRALARSFWLGKDPIGERVALADGKEATIVGVANDVASEHPGSVDGPHFYRWRNMSHPVDSLLVRFRGDAISTSARVPEAIKQLDPDNQARPRTLRAILDETAERFSTMIRMIGVLVGLALSLAILGMYGVVAFTASQRTKELGIRVALGATKSTVIRLVLASGAGPIAWGIAAGAPLALAGTQAVAIVLRHAPVSIQPKDPLTFVAVSSVLGLVGVAASCGRRGARLRSTPCARYATNNRVGLGFNYVIHAWQKRLSVAGGLARVRQIPLKLR